LCGLGSSKWCERCDQENCEDAPFHFSSGYPLSMF
jgi:hypothetical protein